MQPTSKLAGERILITGASGFLGSHLCGFLRQTGNQVHALSRTQHVSDGGVRWWQGDLADVTTTRHLLASIKPSLIFHLTTHGWGAPDLEHVLPTLNSDLIATVNLLTAATELKVRRLVLTCSLEEPQSSDAEVVPSSPYAAAKWACGAYARMFHRLYRTPVALARIFMTYGPGQPNKKLIPYVTLSLLKEEAPDLSNGQRLIDWVYVEDVIRGLVALAEASDVEGFTFDLGSGKLVSIRDVVDQLVSLTGAKVLPRYGALPPRPIEPVRTANVQETYDRLGWQPVTPLDQGLALTVRWYSQQLGNKDSATEPTAPAAEGKNSQKYDWLGPRST